MRRRLTWLAFLAGIVMAFFFRSEIVRATPQNSAFKGSTIAFGTFEEFHTINQVKKNDLPAGFEGDVWLSVEQTKGASDLYVQSNTWEAVNPTTGVVASTGWHSHPGRSMIIVTAGTLTEYHGDCTPILHPKGSTFIDEGGDHAHLIRNESATEAAAGIAVQLVPHDPAKANRRIDMPAPEGCSAF